MSKQEVQDSVGWPPGAERGGALGVTEVTSSALPKTHLLSVQPPFFHSLHLSGAVPLE